MDYAYWAVACKTTGCGLILAKFLGLHDEHALHNRPHNLSPSWIVPCSQCKETHLYTQDDLEVKALDFPPPHFLAWW